MIEQKFRNIYQQILIEPILGFACKFHPSIITLLSGVVGILIILMLYFNYKLAAIICLLISGYLDTLDGSVARKSNKVSDLGSMLDIIIDRVVEGSILFGFFLINPANAIWCFLMLFANLICITAFLVVGVFTKQPSHDKSFFYSPGLIERTEAFIFYTLMIILPEYFRTLATLYIILVIISAILHLRLFYRWDQINKAK